MTQSTFQGNLSIPRATESGFPARKRLNWSLVLGLFLVSAITILGIIGPEIAPRDPLEENNIIQINGKWYIPPFDLGTPGFPLGSDNFGRDLFSRLLWGIQPTMVMIIAVASVRLIVGVLIGLIAGWAGGQIARLFDGLIQLATTLPVLLVALGAIAVVGVELGIWAFIIGLSLTGWVETAIQVREQTRAVKIQEFIEAAYALGSSNIQILRQHILKQIVPLIFMLFAFEVSNTLMATAGLGFLGYYIGGDVWVTVGDFVARRISGMPELGQMLATSWISLTKPWAMVVVGTTIFVAILGFNLIGEGLRQNASLVRVRQKGLVIETWIKLSCWVDQNVTHPLAQFIRIGSVRKGLIGLLTVSILGVMGYQLYHWIPSISISQNAFFPRRTTVSPSSTAPSNMRQPRLSVAESSHNVDQDTFLPRIIWEFTVEGEFDGGPIIFEDERLYAASTEGNLYALTPAGELIWHVTLETSATGEPALDRSGNIYIADKGGGLYKIDPTGTIVWHFQSEASNRSFSGPVIGPNGDIYYTVGTETTGFIQAITDQGKAIWTAQIHTPFFHEAPTLSQDGDYLFLKNDLFEARNGSLIQPETDLKIIRYFPGEEGYNYLISGLNIIQWQLVDNQIEIIDITEWDSSAFNPQIVASDFGVSEDGISWMLFTTPGDSSRVVWISMDDKFLGTASVPISAGKITAILSDFTLLVCGGRPFDKATLNCYVVSPEDTNPLWRIDLGKNGPVGGGFALGDVIYLTTHTGKIIAIKMNGENRSSALESADAPIEIAEAKTKITGPNVVWTYQSGADIGYGPFITSDETVYLINSKPALDILNPDGSQRTSISLDTFLLAPPEASINDQRSFAEILGDSVLVLIDQDKVVRAFNEQGREVWNYALSSNPTSQFEIGDNGYAFLLDDQGGIYAFDSEGFRWYFRSDAARIPAGGLVVGPDGSAYYTITNRGRAFIQAVSSEGKELWSVMVPTDNFYNQLQISRDGSVLALTDVLISVRTGEIIEANPPLPIHEYLLGDDGGFYFRSLHTVIEFTLGPGVMRVVNTATLGDSSLNLRPPFSAHVDSSSVIWLFYPHGSSFRDYDIVWLTKDGSLLGSHSVSLGKFGSFGRYFSYDYANSRLIDCNLIADDKTIQCVIFAPGEERPIFQTDIHGATLLFRGTLISDKIYLFTSTDTLTKISLNP